MAGSEPIIGLASALDLGPKAFPALFLDDDEDIGVGRRVKCFTKCT